MTSTLAAPLTQLDTVSGAAASDIPPSIAPALTLARVTHVDEQQRYPGAVTPSGGSDRSNRRRDTWTGDGYADLEVLFVERAALGVDHPRFAGLRAELVVGYQPVAAHLARRYARRGQPVEDLQQVATIGVIHAVDRFDPAHGSDFLAYLIPTATGEILHYFRDHTWALRPPRRISDLHAAIHRARDALSQDLGRDPLPAEFAAFLGVEPAEVVEAITAGHAYAAVSLDEVLGESDTTLGDVLGRPDPGMCGVEDRAALLAVLSWLPERDRKILMLRFVAGLTQTEIGAEVGLSQMHVSRLLSAALTRLRAALAAPPSARPSPPPAGANS